MLAKTLKWGNSLAFRIPKTMAKECGLEENTPVTITRRKREIVITPMKKEYSLDSLLSEVTQENVHGEVSLGKPIGKELL